MKLSEGSTRAYLCELETSKDPSKRRQEALSPRGSATPCSVKAAVQMGFSETERTPGPELRRRQATVGKLHPPEWLKGKTKPTTCPRGSSTTQSSHTSRSRLVSRKMQIKTACHSQPVSSQREVCTTTWKILCQRLGKQRMPQVLVSHGFLVCQLAY